MDRTLARIGFFDWNLEQDRGRSWEDGIAVARRDMPEHAHIFEAYATGLVVAHDERIPGTSELIEALHERDVNLFGLTNAARASFEAVKLAAPAIGLMQNVVVSADEGVAKPDRRIFETCLERNGLDRSETMFVDDSLANCQAAEAVGIAAHHFSDAEGLEADLRARGIL